MTYNLNKILYIVYDKLQESFYIKLPFATISLLKRPFFQNKFCTSKQQIFRCVLLHCTCFTKLYLQFPWFLEL